ncbi:MULTISPECIES: hypothetical protein [Paraburkholderia]|uniref:DUF4148 domain-containing protein n=1 Tax=Paraburkholderia podalyriae TaxID=1938811 RepID=A0ABR7PTB1_9BURK|nr:hypothetical protein [Paraburkholderia podalyriae]MBC8749481.1 hypothetical protein [Paraburkholderia podalyriae]
MTTVVRYGLLLLAIAFPAFPTFAGARYVEVWNPPEARGDTQRVQPVRNAPKRRRASMRTGRSQLQHRIVAAAPGPKASVAAVGHRTGEPRYDDIPRQITPEGNVLRVGGRHAEVEVER